MKALKHIVLLVAASFMLLSITSCEEEAVDPDPGEVKVAFNYVFGANALPWEINETLRHPKTKDTLTFTEFSFYVSNVRLQNTDGIWWEEPESYHLICAKCSAASSFTLKEVPAGTYQTLEYTLGVDSARNVGGAQIAGLNPANNMFWDFNKGYIMLKAEGQSPQSADGAFTFHLGGYSGEYSVISPRAFAFFGETITVNADATPELSFTTNPARLWHSSPSVAQTSKIMDPGEEAYTMANAFFINIALSEVK